MTAYYRSILTVLLTLMGIVTMLLLLVVGVGAQAATGGTTISRPNDPVILTGADLPEFLNSPIADLALYAYDGSAWTAIPFQVDEVLSTGEYIAQGEDDDDGGLALLDANDEVVFMGYDSGEPTTCAESNAVISTPHNRQRIDVADPLSAETGTVYLYENAPGTAASYISWNEASQTQMGNFNGTYTGVLGGGADPQIVGIDALQLAGPDILDRLKIRFAGISQVAVISCNFFPLTVPVEFDEITLAEQITPTVDYDSVGPIRAISGIAGDATQAAYGSRFDLAVGFDPAALVAPPVCSISLTDIRVSLDLNDPATTGMTTYFDSQTPAGATIDGSPDAGLPAATPINWHQVSGNNVSGFVVTYPTVSAGSGSVQNYYVDNSSGAVTGDGTADTGDNLSFSDTGLRLINTGDSMIEVSLVTYILPTNTNSNVGATYFDYVNNPLVGTGGAGNQEACTVATAVEMGSVSTDSVLQTTTLLRIFAYIGLFLTGLVWFLLRSSKQTA